MGHFRELQWWTERLQERTKTTKRKERGGEEEEEVVWLLVGRAASHHQCVHKMAKRRGGGGGKDAGVGSTGVSNCRADKPPPRSRQAGVTWGVVVDWEVVIPREWVGGHTHTHTHRILYYTPERGSAPGIAAAWL